MFKLPFPKRKIVLYFKKCLSFDRVLKVATFIVFCSLFLQIKSADVNLKIKISF